MFLDFVGKWSLVDTFVLVLFMVSFQLRWHDGTEGAMDLEVNPFYGFHTFVVATVMQLVLGHIALGVHRHAAGLQMCLRQWGPEKLSLSETTQSRMARYGVLPAVVLCMVLMII